MRSVIIKNRRIVEDHWQHLADAVELPDGSVIVSRARWQKERSALLERRQARAVAEYCERERCRSGFAVFASR